MGDLGGTAAPQQDTHDVDTDAGGVHLVLVQRASGEPAEAGSLLGTHGLQRVAVGGRAARLDLAEDQDVAVAEHQVDLACVAAPVAVDEHHAVLDQPTGGEPLAVLADAPVALSPGHGSHPSPERGRRAYDEARPVDGGGSATTCGRQRVTW